MVINADTKVIGIIGSPLKQTLSPLMHNLTLKQMGLNYAYVPFPIDKNSLSDALNGLRGLNILGLNVTIPFKEEVIPLLDDLSEEARGCGAVNVIKNVDGYLTGYNTDGRGFVTSLKEAGVSLEGRALFIGAGGAARSTAWELAQAGISHIDFLDTNVAKASMMADFINNSNCSSAGINMREEIFGELCKLADIIVNASPVGMFPQIDQSPVDSLDMVPDHTVLCDLIYNPLTTRFLSMAQERGLKTVSGVNMFVYQGAYTLEILTENKPPVEFMKEVVLHQLAY